MKDPFGSFFHSLLERFSRPRRIPAAQALSPKQFRELLIQTLDDPATARLLARKLLLPTFPVCGGLSTAADDVSHGDFGSNCSPDTGDYTFSRSKVGIKKTSPGEALDVSGNIKASQSIMPGSGYDIRWGETSTRILGVAGANGYLEFVTNEAERMRIVSSGKVGVGTANPQAKLHVQSGNMSSDFYGTVAVETTGNTDLNLIAGASSIASLNFGDTDGNVGKIEYNHANDSMRFHTNAAERMRIDSSGKVGIGTTSPDNKLHVMDGHIAIEAAGGAGKLKFRESGTTHTEVYRDDADFLVVRNWVEDYTNLKIWARQESSFPTEPREATLALVRALDDETKAEFLDLYNNYYSSQKQYGIRIQKRNPQGQSVAQYRDFVFDQYDGNTDGPGGSRIYYPILKLKADRTLHFQSHADTNSWTETASIYATAAVKTTTSGAVAIATIPLSTSRTYQIVVRVVARETGETPDYALLYRAALAYREGGGPTIVGSDNVMPAIASAGATGWTCTFAVSGNNIEVRVQSGADITVYWVATIERQSVGTDS